MNYSIFQLTSIVPFHSTELQLYETDDRRIALLFCETVEVSQNNS